MRFIITDYSQLYSASVLEETLHFFSVNFKVIFEESNLTFTENSTLCHLKIAYNELIWKTI